MKTVLFVLAVALSTSGCRGCEEQSGEYEQGQQPAQGSAPTPDPLTSANVNSERHLNPRSTERSWRAMMIDSGVTD